ncbi:MAG: tyrosine-type recombinase/integrase [Clostridiales bacterium]|nr:tyrosine-type recombinase/integrase [Clostridiales bacterium]
MEHVWDYAMLEEFRNELLKEEKSAVTIEKYMRDVKAFFAHMENTAISKERVIGYKQDLRERYADTSVNSILAALNRFFKFAGWYDCTVKSLKVQKKAFRAGNRELTRKEYYQLLDAAKTKGDWKTFLVMETICSTGIRVGELRFITVEALHERRATVTLKNKTRTVILSEELCKVLKNYVQKEKIRHGSIFVTKSGKPLDRSNILHAMKALCENAEVTPSKVFPHNLRHLFACRYYQLEKDLSHLADLLGHSDINTTRIYTLRSDKEEAKRIEMLGLVVQME